MLAQWDAEEARIQDERLKMQDERTRLRAILALVKKWKADAKKSRCADRTGFEAGQVYRLRCCIDEINGTKV